MSEADRGPPRPSWSCSEGGVVDLYCEDCLEVVRQLPDECIDAVVTDPPYGIAFMGKDWDRVTAGWYESWAKELLRVVKPGAHIAAFGSPRRHHWLMTGLEAAGWEIRDCLIWLHGSGFPKGLNLAKAFDGVIGKQSRAFNVAGGVDRFGVANPAFGKRGGCVYEAKTELARRWSGWATGLRPTWEPIVLARRSLRGTVVQNVKRFGVGGINVEACGVFERGAAGGTESEDCKLHTRWPTNTLLSHERGCSPEGCVEGCPVVEVSRQIGQGDREAQRIFPTFFVDEGQGDVVDDDLRGCCRFLYSSRASHGEREIDSRVVRGLRGRMADRVASDREEKPSRRAAYHPTVKPVPVVEWLLRLVTPPGGVVLDPFVGSGTTAVACLRLGFCCIGIEMDRTYFDIAVGRVMREREALGFLSPSESLPGHQLGVFGAGEGSRRGGSCV